MAATTNNLRVLCLHGFRTSGKILGFQCRDFPKDVLTMDFVDSCHEATGPAQEIIQKIFAGMDYFEWWNYRNEQYEGLEETMKYLKSYVAANGPFHGVLGFSQGGALATMLLDNHERLGKDAVMPDLKFGILCAAFLPKNLYDRQKVSTLPVLTCHGRGDQVVRASDELLEKFVDPVVVEFDGGHELPNKVNAAPALAQIRKFVMKMSSSSDNGKHKM